MKLEEEIKQKKFNSEFDKLAVNIIFTSNWLHLIYSQALKPHNITNQQFNVLRILRGQHPNAISVSQIKSRMLDKMSDASRLVDRLIEKNLVEREICKNDRRRTEVKITDAGLKLLKEIDSEIPAIRKKLHRLSAKEAKTINDLLDKLRG